MAAIAGILRLDAAPGALRDARVVMAGMARRSPHSVGWFEDGCFALAHGALHTTPESLHEHQPIRLGERWTLAVDGRVDNRDTLIRALRIDVADVVKLGDADLFAQAWLRWGSDFWKQIVGDFALAVWDRQERRLILLRDRIGVRPLYFAHSANLLAFASEPEPLLGLDGVSRACNEDALAHLLVPSFQREDLGATIYRDVRRVLPGETLLASEDGNVQVRRYWSMQPGAALRLRDPREYVDAFRQVYGDAVHCRLRSLQRPALMLSGGIDSASVLAAARLLHASGQAQGPLPISIVNDQDQGCDETRNILYLHGEGEGIRLPVSELLENPLFGYLCDAIFARAHPVDNSLLYARLVCLAARGVGSNVLLDGADGDVLMLVDDHYAGGLALASHPLRALREARLASRVNTYLWGMPPWRILARGMAAKLEPSWLAVWRYRRNDRRWGDAELGPWIESGFAQRLRLRERRLDRAITHHRLRARGQRADMLLGTWWNPGFTRTMEGTDRTYADFGVEARHPWCDQRVVEFFLNLPEEYVSRDGWTKWIARAAYADTLGDAVAWYSGKYHLGSQVALCALDAADVQVSALLVQARDTLQGILDKQALNGLCNGWAARKDGASIDLGKVLDITTLMAWMQRFGLQQPL